jgi:N-acetyl-anhydromuramyl-L-alanine amidase AmpD
MRTLVALLLTLLVGCTPTPKLGDRLERRGDEIVIAGQYFHTGAPVILWTDPGGYDAYRVERRFAPLDQSDWASTEREWATKNDGRVITPNRYGLRATLSPEDLPRVRGGGWSLDDLRRRIDQFVLHYDVCGTSQQCFNILHDHRGLSVHFMIDLDGTIYQTLDLKERARHATIANDRSVGVEIANMGAYPVGKPNPFEQWYSRDERGRTFITIPPRFKDGGLRIAPTTDRPLRPRRNEPIVGNVQNLDLVMYDLTPAQYESLAKLSATLCTVLPKIRPDYPRDSQGRLIPRQLSPEQFRDFAGILGHYHVQANKQDPGPALDWDWLLGETTRLMNDRPPSPTPPAEPRPDAADR